MSWPLVPLGQVAEIVGGSTPRREEPRYWGPGHFWATPTDLPMPGEGILDLESTSETITKEGLDSSSANLLPVGTVLYSTRATIGKLAIAKVPVATNQGFNNLISGPAIYNRYLAYALQHSTPDISRLAGSTTFKEVSRLSLRGFKIAVPPISEQKRMVELLDEADCLRRLRREADAKAARILPALFLKMFGDPATNPMGWQLGTLGQFGIEARYGLGQPPKQSQSGLPLLRATNINAGDISERNLIFVDEADVPKSRKAFLEANEVLVVRSGAYTGDVAQVTDKWAGSVAGYDMVLSPPEGWHAEFVEQLLLTTFVQGYFTSQKGRAGQPHLNATQLEATPAFAPPEPKQSEFAEHVRALRVLKTQFRSAELKIEHLFSSLLQKAFSGQLTAKWRAGRMKELLAEMAEQAKLLNLPAPQALAS